MAFFAFGQDVRLAGARTAMNSMPRSVMMGKLPADAIPVRIDDPLGRGDSEPSGGASKLGDIISGAFSIYSPKLQKALTDFGVKFDFKAVQVFLPGKEEAIEGYAWARGAPSVEVPSLEFFEIDAAKTQGHALFDASLNFATVRVVTAALKQHLEAAGLEGVYFVPTKEYGGALAMVLTMG
ncbi:MAG: hypothetical protein QM817_37225 [Archangium sp.]